MASLILLSSAFNHIWLNKHDTKSILKWYSPQQVNGNLFCRVGINNYVKSVILISNPRENINSIYDVNHKNLLIFSESEKIVVKFVLWNDNNEEHFQEFIDYLNYFCMYKKIHYEYNNEI